MTPPAISRASKRSHSSGENSSKTKTRKKTQHPSSNRCTPTNFLKAEPLRNTPIQHRSKRPIAALINRKQLVRPAPTPRILTHMPQPHTRRNRPNPWLINTFHPNININR